MSFSDGDPVVAKLKGTVLHANGAAGPDYIWVSFEGVGPWLVPRASIEKIAGPKREVKP